MSSTLLLASIFTEYDAAHDRTLWKAMPILIGVLCILAIAYRYYSAFLAARVAVLDDSRETPAYRFNDGQNYHPTNKWVLFGHHFAAISGAGPLIGPVLAIQYGYFPGLLWLVIGVTLAGAMQDMLVMAASVRHNGQSLAAIARQQLGRSASVIVSAAILFIVVIALAGLGYVVVKALGGDEIKLPKGMQVIVPAGQPVETRVAGNPPVNLYWHFPGGCSIRYPGQDTTITRPEPFRVRNRAADKLQTGPGNNVTSDMRVAGSTESTFELPAGCVQVIPGSSWGTFTIAATIPIALLVGLYMYRIRPGKVVEASLLGGSMVIAATIAGNWVPGSPWEGFFSLGHGETIVALAVYGFIASVLPVWLLLGPRDYLSSFLKIGTIALLVLGVILANPTLQTPPFNDVFRNGGPTFTGHIFPFVFICIMCGAISGFHALVSSGTTPKMIEKESLIRPIGYGAMLCEGLVGVMALIAASALPVDLYYDINVDIDRAPKFQSQLQEVYSRYGRDPMHQTGVHALQHLNLAQVEQMVGNESLRGRTGGAVTLAVGMATIFTDALKWTGATIGPLLKYWYHFAIMFEALFILTTIDAGTRIGRFLVQEALGKVYAPAGRTGWLPGAIFASALVTVGWAVLVWTGSIDTIWPMFGIANQLLAVLALTLVTTWLVNVGRGRYVWVTILPMLFVTATTMTAGAQMITDRFPAMIDAGQRFRGWLNIALTLFVMATVGALLLMAASRWVGVLTGMVPRPKATETR